jgi:Protein of unknown function (DUF2911)
MRSRTAAFVLSFLLPLAGPASAQIRASERGSASQTVDGTVITVEYARPQIRSREKVFGGVVRQGETWTPGANWATTLEFSKPVRLNGQEVAAGKYSVWMVPGPAEWKVNLHKDHHRYHTQHPKLEEMFVSFPVKPDSGENLEILTFDFPRVAKDGATLRLRWSTVVVPLEIQVQSSRGGVAALDPSQLAPYLGSYTLTVEGEGGKTIEMKAEVIIANGSLRMAVDGAWGPFTMEFIPTKEPHRFLPAFVDKGEVADVEEVPVIFDVQDGRATGFVIMGIGTDVWMRGKRKS